MSFSLFPAFFEHPSKIKFAQQEDDEYIELLLRRHWFTNLGWIIITIIGLVLPLFLASLGDFLLVTLNLSVPTNVIIALLILWYLLVLAYAIENYLFWYFNIYVVTNKHLADIIFHTMLSRDITEVRLDDVQSARSKIAGIAGSLFNFGDVHIETAAERLNISFNAVPKPDFVADRIQDLQELQEGVNSDVG